MAEDETTKRTERFAPWVPLAAFAFVVIALLALAVTPSLMVRRIARVTNEASDVFLPVYGALEDYAFAMEARIASVRTGVVMQDPEYRLDLAAARTAEDSAMTRLRAIAPRLGERFEEELEILQEWSDRRDSLESSLSELDGGLDAYRDAVPTFDMYRDSMLVHVRELEDEFAARTDASIAAAREAARLQQTLAAVLGLTALLAALTVGWFALTQRRMRREAEQLRSRAESQRAELQRITESRTRLARGFTHDVKNPLGAASGYLELLEMGVHGPLTDEQQQSVSRAAGSIATALGLVEDLLELARAESGRIDVRPEPTDLARLVDDVAAEHRAQADRKGLALEVETPAEPLVSITDPRRVRQILGNLVTNAVKYTHEGRVTVRVGADGAEGPNGESVSIAVSDTGPGISDEQQKLLFQEFVRLDPEATDGAGVGLAISRRVARLLGGDITVQSRPGTGSTFTLWLPDDRRRAERRVDD